MLIRLNKYLADCGIASRRKAEELILAGKIKANDKIIKNLSTKIDPQKDKIYYKNKLIKPQEFIYIKLNKPQGYTCTTKKFKTEKNILDLIDIKEKIFPVGRLDKNSQGLFFLTNDGNWAYQLTHPKFQITKKYQVKINKPINVQHLKQMQKGVSDQQQLLKIQDYKIINSTTVNLVLTQGHKREIRRLFEHFKYQIKQLKRIQIAKWRIGDLPEGQWEYFQPK